jgi:hypothetical protein
MVAPKPRQHRQGPLMVNAADHGLPAPGCRRRGKPPFLAATRSEPVSIRVGDALRYGPGDLERRQQAPSRPFAGEGAPAGGERKSREGPDPPQPWRLLPPRGLSTSHQQRWTITPRLSCGRPVAAHFHPHYITGIPSAVLGDRCLRVVWGPRAAGRQALGSNGLP